MFCLFTSVWFCCSVHHCNNDIADSCLQQHKCVQTLHMIACFYCCFLDCMRCLYSSLSGTRDGYVSSNFHFECRFKAVFSWYDHKETEFVKDASSNFTYLKHLLQPQTLNISTKYQQRYICLLESPKICILAKHNQTWIENFSPTFEHLQ